MPRPPLRYLTALASIIQMHFHKLGTYELQGRHAALFAANLRAIDNLSPRTASRLVHRLGESSTPQAWEQEFTSKHSRQQLIDNNNTSNGEAENETERTNHEHVVAFTFRFNSLNFALANCVASSLRTLLGRPPPADPKPSQFFGPKTRGHVPAL